MNAQAILQSQGWRGHGHTLHKTDDSTGLAKPLLISRKDNTLGVGKKEHCTSDQWWLNAFDQQLQGLDTTSKKGAVVQTVKHGALNVIEKGPAGKYVGASGLYASFVRGGMLEGTMYTPSSGDSTPTTRTTMESTPETDHLSVRGGETRGERKARRAAKRREKAESRARESGGLLDVESILAARRAKKLESKALESMEERRARREAKRKRKDERMRGTGG